MRLRQPMYRACLLIMSLMVLCIASSAVAQSAGRTGGGMGFSQSRSFSSFQSRGGGQAGRSGPSARPAFSPYLNLLRSGNSTLFNYYGLVKPEVDFRAADQQFSQQFGEINGEMRSVERELSGSKLSETGHGVTFLGDLRGGPGSFSQSQQDRMPKVRNPYAASNLGNTGHSAYFNNHGPWYQGQGPR